MKILLTLIVAISFMSINIVAQKKCLERYIPKIFQVRYELMSS